MQFGLIISYDFNQYLPGSFKDGVEITDDDSRMEINKERASAGFFELVIAEVLKTDAATYSCTASNKYGEESCECTMSVCGKLTYFLRKQCSNNKPLQRTRTSLVN